MSYSRTGGSPPVSATSRIGTRSVVSGPSAVSRAVRSSYTLREFGYAAAKSIIGSALVLREGRRRDCRAPSAGLNRVRFQGFLSIPFGDTPGGLGDYTPRVMSPSTAGRAALLALLAWWTIRFVPHPLDPEVIGGFLHLINLPFHEAGHIVFSPFGDFMTVLGGSLFQIIVPLICAGAFVRRAIGFPPRRALVGGREPRRRRALHRRCTGAAADAASAGRPAPRCTATTGKRFSSGLAGCISTSASAWAPTSSAASSWSCRLVSALAAL